MIEMEVTLDHVADDLEFRVSRERNFTRQHNVKYDAQGPNINLRVVVL